MWVWCERLGLFIFVDKQIILRRRDPIAYLSVDGWDREGDEENSERYGDEYGQ